MNARAGVRPRAHGITSLAATATRWTLPVLLVALSSGTASALTTYTWIGATPGVWTNAANWSPARNTPAADDILLFDGATTPTPSITGVITQGIGRMVLLNGILLHLQGLSPGPITLTINGGAGTDLDVPTGTTLFAIGGGGRISIALATGTTGLVAGSVDATGQLTAADASALTFASGGELTCRGIPGSHIFGTTSLNSVVFQSGSTYIASGGSDPFGAAAPSSVVVFQTGSLYQYESGDAPSISGRTYADFAYVSGSSKTFSGTLPFTVDDLTLTGGTMRVQVPTTTIKGDIWETGGHLDFDGSNQAIFLGGTAPQLVRGSPAFSASSTLTINNPAGVTHELGHLALTKLVLDGGNLVLNATPLDISLQLTLTNGIITTGGASVNLNAPAATVVGGSAASYVNGNLQKSVAVSAGVLQKKFEIGDATTYAPVTLSFSSVSTAGLVAASTHPGDHANLGTSGLDVAHSVNRFWVLSKNATVFPSCSATFTFDPADVDPGTNAAQFEVRRFTAPATWSTTTTGARTTTTTQCSGLSAFGDFAIGEPCAVTLFYDDLDGTPGVDLVGTTPNFGGNAYVGHHIQPSGQIHFAVGGGVEDVGPNLRTTATICQSTLVTPLTLSSLPAGEMLHYQVTMANISAMPQTNVFESSRVDLVTSTGALITLGELSNGGYWGASSSALSPITSGLTTAQSGNFRLDLYLDPLDAFGDGPTDNAYVIVNGGATLAGHMAGLALGTTISAVELVRNLDDEVFWRGLTLERVRGCAFPPPPLPCTPAPPNMVAWWPLDEVGDTTAVDIAGVSMAALIGGPARIPGEVDGALRLANGGQYVRAPSNASLDFGTGDYSMDAWVRTSDATATVRTIIDKRDFGSPAGYSLYLYQGHLGGQIADASGFTNYNSPSPYIPDGVWHHVAMTVARAGNGTLYVDGAPAMVFDATVRPGSVTNPGALRVGQSFNDGSASFNGDVDEVELFNRALTAEEILALFSAGASGKCKPVSGVGQFVEPPARSFLTILNNPLRSGDARILFRLDQPDEVDVRIFDVAGRLRKSIPMGRLGPGEHGLAWNGAWEGGHNAARGIYFVQVSLRGGGVKASQRILVLK